MRKKSSKCLSLDLKVIKLENLKNILFLQSLTIKDLRCVAKKYGISLKSLLSKADIVNLMHSKFCLIEKEVIVEENFIILLDDQGCIDIST